MENSLDKEAKIIAHERTTYSGNKNLIGIKIFDYLSLCFLVIGFILLVLVPFTEITLVQATCFFVINYVLAPSDGDNYQLVIKGMAQDLANIRLNTAVLRSKLLGENENK